MRNFALIIGCFAMLSFQNPSKIMSGDLFFKRVEFVNFYGLDSDQKKIAEDYFLSVTSKKNPTPDDVKVLEHLDWMKKFHVENKPYIRIQDDHEKNIIVFLSDDDYSRLSGFNLQELQREGKKVTLKLDVELLDDSAVICKEILKLEKLDGVTPWKM